MKNRKILPPALLFTIVAFGLILTTSVGEASAVSVSMLDDHVITHSAVDSSSAVSAIAPIMSSVVAQGQATPMVAEDQSPTTQLENNNAVAILGYNDPGCCDVGSWTNITQVDAGYRHTVGLKADGTVVAVRDEQEDNYGECNVGGWMDIIQVAAGAYHTVGLKADGTVVAVGRNDHGECDVDNWADIIWVDAGGGLAGGHTVGLKADGTAVAVGWNELEQCEVDDWADLIQLLAGRHFTVGLKADGTAVAVGRNYYGQCDVGNWSGIIQIDPGAWHTVGLKADGTVVAVGCSNEGWNAQWGQCEVCNWSGIIHASAGGYHTVGLKADHTVVAVGENAVGQCNVGGWTDIIQVDAGKWHTVGIKADGTVVAVGGKPAVPLLCFIATAAYGTPMAQEIQILRKFRDGYLLTTPVGRALVDFYYKISPPAADFINEHPGLKPMVRAGLVPAVAMSIIAINATPAEKVAILGLVALLSLALALGTRKTAKQRSRV